ncbi:MAG: proline dehydrogenase family protein [Flavobacteriales bacterium]|nr:proline dehydrogenase family protein [Flavobacteriales bacterium]MCB9204825.1 proline dehydrogenase family protein [Flavobacteriales bacterium]
MVSFENTEIAFADKSDKELERAYLLFKLVGSPTLVSFGKRALNIALGLRLPIKGLIRNTVFDHFCGGETISQCDETIGRLHRHNVFSLLDYSSEGKETNTELDHSAKEIIAANNAGKADKRIPFSVFKPTAIFPNRLLAKKNAGAKFSDAEQKDWEAARFRMATICETARKNDVPIFVDAEETWFQDAIDELVEEQMKLHNREKAIVYNTIQLYRKDRLDFLKTSFAKAQNEGYKLGVKLVRGAYMEKERQRAKDQGYPSPINDTKSETDRDYNAALKFCVDNHPNIYLIAGTHNEESAQNLVKLMGEKSLESGDNRIVFSQLYGMSDNISFNLAASGYNVVKYVPYGPIVDVMPYLIRRAEENTSVAGQTGRELSLIMKEKARRKAS